LFVLVVVAVQPIDLSVAGVAALEKRVHQKGTSSAPNSSDKVRTDQRRRVI
jgi:hypothetical protein